jgi:uncharacterized protein YvpB/LysM repeat protein
MERSLAAPASGAASSHAAAVVGASYTFDPAADGVAGIYALRVLERGGDPRALSAEFRHHRGADAPPAPFRAAPPLRFGRGTSAHRPHARGDRPPAESLPMGTVRFGRQAVIPERRWGRRLATVGLILLLLLPLSVIAAHAQETAFQARYIVQPGDTLDGVAAAFGVDPAAILAASAIQNPPHLTPAEVIIIPAPWESPEEAVATAAQRVGTSPFVAAAHEVAPGETLARIAGDYGLDPWTLAAFNGVSDVDTLDAGQRLRIPLTDTVTLPVDSATTEVEIAAPAEAVGGPAEPMWEEPASGPVFAREVPAYQQMYSLSCEYAAAYIATAAFGAGVPESAFMERIGLSANPHWGYRGNIHGPWGGTDDYGIYPEALVPTLNEFGFIGDVFYGGDPSALTARIDAGMPVITWLGYFGDTGWVQEDEGSYLLVPGMHVVTVYGYDDWGVYLANPGRGMHNYYAWGDFLAMWAVMDGMALGVAPM